MKITRRQLKNLILESLGDGRSNRKELELAKKVIDDAIEEEEYEDGWEQTNFLIKIDEQNDSYIAMSDFQDVNLYEKANSLEELYKKLQGKIDDYDELKITFTYIESWLSEGWADSGKENVFELDLEGKEWIISTLGRAQGDIEDIEYEMRRTGTYGV